ncbi:MAG: nitronate monooxygenase [Rhodospirillales bacterium]|nr:nitronate monooxygenase [Rhodospirillales bacterium]
MTDNGAKEKLNRLWQPGLDFLGCDVAIMGGGMSWVSERNLVAATSNAGAFGVIGCGAMPPDILAAEIAGTKELTSKNFGVNLITMHPDLDALIDVCLEQRVSHIVLAGGLPTGASIKRAKDGGAKVICFSPAVALAKRLVRSGADALVVEGSEAGGHIGPVATSVLAQEILPQIKEVPIFVAGGIGRGEAILSYLEMGAAGCQVGTRIVCATESIAHHDFKKAFIRAKAKDAMPTIQIDPRFPVIPVRAITNKGTERFMEFQREIIQRFNNEEISQHDGQLEIEKYWAGALRNAVIDGDVENGSLMAGQVVGMVSSEQPMQEIMDELVEQAASALMIRNYS